MKSNLRNSMALLCVTLACSAAAFAQGGGRGRGGAFAGSGAQGPQLIGGRFKAYPADSIERGTAAYNTTCGYCHGDRAKGGNAGPDLITSDVSLHDEDGVGLAQYLKGATHQKAVKLDLQQPAVYDIASYIHSRIIYAANTRGEVSPEAVLKAGDAKAGEAYFNGAGGCAKCHSVTGNLKGIGAKYDAVNLQDKIVNPRMGGGRGGRGGRGEPGAPAPPDPNAITATVTLPDGKTFTGIPLRITDFDVTLRLPDGSTPTWVRENGVPKVERHDPLQTHVDIMTRLKDKDMHDLTAYLATIK
jgi:cytochrome c oxidase cbb3-type subunit 3